MLVYISHPFSGLEENKLKIENIIRTLTLSYPDNTYVSPVHCFGFLYNDVSYENGLEFCLNLLEKCDKMMVFGDWRSSRGCTAEILFAEMHMIPYEIMEGNICQ